MNRGVVLQWSKKKLRNNKLTYLSRTYFEVLGKMSLKQMLGDCYEVISSRFRLYLKNISQLKLFGRTLKWPLSALCCGTGED